MAARRLIERLDERRLALALALFFVALAVPAGVLAWRAWGQVQWEVFHRYRLQAEEAALRVDERLSRALAAEDARSVTDYRFGGAGGRSPLAAWPVAPTIPGLIGHFEIDAAGRISSPLSPPAAADAAMDPGERAGRRALVERLRAILSAPVTVEEKAVVAAGRGDAVSTDNAFERLASAAPAAGAMLQDALADASLDERRARQRPEPAGSAALRAPQLVHKRAKRTEQVAVLEAVEADAAPLEFTLDSVVVAAQEAPGDDAEREAPARPAAAPRAAAPSPAPARDSGAARVRLFESELDPLVFAALDARYFVLFRNVWRDGERTIQGAVIEREALHEALLAAAWRSTGLAAAADFALTWQGEVVARGRAQRAASAASVDAADGELLHRARLSAPLAGIELVYRVADLPLGASAHYLAWASLAMLLMLGGGCFAMYRFGAGQMRLARQQRDFVSAVSHELKTPLTSIRMYSEMLEAGWADEARRQTYYRYIRDESERLSRLIGNVLELARLSRGSERPAARPVQLGAALERIRPKLVAQLAAADFTLESRIAPDAAAREVRLDEDAFAQILINLVDNAIKFTPQGAERRVVLGAEPAPGGAVRVSVRDHGAGIPRSQMRQIFELFYRGENELTRETVGTGIGLALVLELAQAMDATVDVGNREPGAEFSVTLAAP